MERSTFTEKGMGRSTFTEKGMERSTFMVDRGGRAIARRSAVDH